MALTTEELTRLTRMAGESTKDTADRMLSDEQLQEIADEVGRVKDDSDLAPEDTGYTNTYDLYRSAAECWREKAGMIAEGYNVVIEGAQYNRSEAFEHYLSQATRYAGMANSLTVVTG